MFYKYWAGTKFVALDLRARNLTQGSKKYVMLRQTKKLTNHSSKLSFCRNAPRVARRSRRGESIILVPGSGVFPRVIAVVVVVVVAVFVDVSPWWRRRRRTAPAATVPSPLPE